ncbi:MAG TPA: hypothetical protein VLH61_09605, partial [Bacteroidales bacterium]|nr:hypothetical protein [Bacteroidales bacterium]
MNQDLIIIGAGNVGAFLAYNLGLFEGSYNLLGFLDDDQAKVGSTLAGLKVLGPVGSIAQFPAGTAVAVGVAAPIARKAIMEKIGHYPLAFP